MKPMYVVTRLSLSIEFPCWFTLLERQGIAFYLISIEETGVCFNPPSQIRYRGDLAWNTNEGTGTLRCPTKNGDIVATIDKLGSGPNYVLWMHHGTEEFYRQWGRRIQTWIVYEAERRGICIDSK